MNSLSSRLEVILNEFIKNDKYHTSEQLAIITKVSARTIKKDIQELNEFLVSFNVEIGAKTGVGYHLIISDKQLYLQLLNDLKEREIHLIDEIPKYRYERVNYIIKKMLSVDYYITLEDLMDELYISRSTLTADMKEVRETFKDFNLEIITKPNYGIILDGDEIAKRQCIAEYFFHPSIFTGYFAADNAMFVSNTNQSEIGYIRDILCDINEKLEINMSDQSFQNFVIHILIAVRRWRFYNYIKEENQDVICIATNSKEFIAAKELVDRIEEKLELLLPKSEIYYFALHFKTKHIAILDELNRQEIEKVEKTFYDIYSMLQKNYNYLVINKQVYEENIRLHIPAMVSRLKTRLVMRNPQIYEILGKYLTSTHITVLISSIIEKNFNVKMNKNEFAYLVLYTHLLINYGMVINGKVLLVCGRGRPETITLLNDLNESNSRSLDDVEICNVSSLNNKNLSKYELILSTVPLKIAETFPYYYLEGDVLNAEDIKTIIKKNRVSYKKVKKYFNVKYFNSNLIGSVRDEVFKSIAKQLNMKELVNGFWEAEHIISHETNKGVVFLHLLNPFVTNFIYVGILNKRIIWNKQWAEIVIFVNINQNIEDIYSCYYYLSESLMKEDCLAKVNGVKTFQEFEEIISRKGNTEGK